MLDLEQAQANQHAYYTSNDYQWGINSIERFAFTDPALVPELFRNFAMEYFNLERYSRVDLDELNRVLNELWEGPGSTAKISDVIWTIRRQRRAALTDPVSALKNYVVPTVDSDLQPTED